MKLVIGILMCILSVPSIAQRQGVKGQLFLVTGNQMPGPDKVHIPRKGTVREIYVYELTNIAEADKEEGFYKKVHTKFVKSMFSKTDGTFKIKLPPGNYSLFVKENIGYGKVIKTRLFRCVAHHVNPAKAGTQKIS